MHLKGYQESLRYTTGRKKSLSENETERKKKQQIELNKGKNQCGDCALLAQDHNISGRCFHICADVILPAVSSVVTREKQQITSSFGLSIYTKGASSNLAKENRLNVHFYLHHDIYTVCVGKK